MSGLTVGGSWPRLTLNKASPPPKVTGDNREMLVVYFNELITSVSRHVTNYARPTRVVLFYRIQCN